MSKHEDINPNDPLFLISRDLDGDLNTAEKSRLEKLLSESIELQGQNAAFRSVNALLTDQRENEARIDWLNFEKLVLARVEEADENTDALDRALQAWGRRQPDWNEDRFAGQVLGRLSHPQKRGMTWSKTLRLGAPLAAAAAIVIALTATWQTPAPVVNLAPVALVEIHRADFRQTETTVSVVSFARTVPRPSVIEESVSFGYMTLGSSPVAQQEEAPL